MRKELRRATRGLWGWSVVAALLVGGFVAPATVRAEDDAYYSDAYAEEEGPLKECLDNASKEYNSCLYEAGTRWGRLMCDLIYESETALCWAEQIGKAKIHALLTRLAREQSRYTPAFQL